MRLLPVPLLLILALTACSTHRFVASTHPNGKPEVVLYLEGKGEEAVKVMEKVYYPNGKLEYVGRFQNGVEHGEWVYYYETGIKKVVEHWENGVEQGLHLDYSPDGQVTREIVYDKGRVVSELDKTRK